MPEFIRPAARAAIWRWRDVLVATGILTLGLWWALASFGIVRWLGYALVLLGIVLLVAGIQRGRFRQGGGGPGVVQIDERRLAYFGPLTGGVMDMDDLTRLELEPVALPSPHWVLTGIGGQTLAIPVNAEGADALFDIFASLPGIKTDEMLSVLSRTPDMRVIIWQATRPLLH